MDWLSVEDDEKRSSRMTIIYGTSMVVQWIRIRLAMQGMQAQSLVRELRLYMSCSNSVCMLQLISPCALEPVLLNKRGHHNEKPVHHNLESSSFSPQVEKAQAPQQRPSTVKKEINKKNDHNLNNTHLVNKLMELYLTFMKHLKIQYPFCEAHSWF